MKNINLTPPSSKPVKEARGNKPFILVGLIILMLLCVVYFSQTTPLGKRWLSRLTARDSSGTKPKSSAIVPRPKKISAAVKAPQENAPDVKEAHDSTTGTATESHEQAGKAPGKEIPIRKNVQEGGDAPPGVMKDDPHAEHKDAQIPAPKATTDEPKGGAGSSEVAQMKAPAETKEHKETQAKQKTELKERPREEVSQASLREGAATSPSGYYIQLCSCVVKENAEGLLKKMIGMGYSPVLRENPGKVRMLNVYSSKFTQKSEAVKVLNHLKGEGFDPVLIPSAEGRFILRIASCIHKESAREIVTKLSRQGYRTDIREEMTRMTLYSVVLQNFVNAKEAEAVRQDLIKKGFESPILKSNPQAS
jgi:cell division septation protein DedD